MGIKMMRCPVCGKETYQRPGRSTRRDRSWKCMGCKSVNRVEKRRYRR